MTPGLPMRALLTAAVLVAAVGLGSGAAVSQDPIEGNVQRVFDRGIIVVDNTTVRLWGVIAPRTGEATSGRTQLALRQWTLGQHVHCEPVRQNAERQVVARCLADGLDLGAALVSSGLGSSCQVDGVVPYGKLDKVEPRGSCPP